MTYNPTDHFARTDVVSSRGKLAKATVSNADLRTKLAEELAEVVADSQATGEVPDAKRQERLIQQTLLLDLSDQLLAEKTDPYQTRETVKALGAWRSSGRKPVTPVNPDGISDEWAKELEAKVSATGKK